MTLTMKDLRKWEESAFTRFTAAQRQIILDRFGTEPLPYEWSEQDIYTQIGNYLHCGHWEKPSVDCSSSEVFPDGVEF